MNASVTPLIPFNTTNITDDMGNLLNHTLYDLVPTGPCPPHEPYDLSRFILVVVGGTPFAALGLPFNLLLFYLLISEPAARSTVKIYLIALSACDVLVCLLYILLFSMDAIALFFRLETLWRMWHYYAMPGYAISMIIQYSSKYLLVCATVDRFIVVFKIPQCFWYYRTKYGRITVITIVVLLAVAMGMPSTWDYSIVDQSHENCSDPFDTLSFVPNLVLNQFYSQVYKFYIVTAVVTFVPFVVLLLLNVLIVGNIRKDLVETSKRKKQIKEQKRASGSKMTLTIPGRGDNKMTELIQDAMMRNRLNAATYTTCAIVSIFLVCTCLDTAIKTLERLYPVPILMNADGSSTPFYRYMTDVVSILFVINSFLRLFICKACDPHVRSQYHKTIRRLFTFKSPGSPSTIQANSNYGTSHADACKTLSESVPASRSVSVARTRWHSAYSHAKRNTVATANSSSGDELQMHVVDTRREPDAVDLDTASPSPSTTILSTSTDKICDENSRLLTIQSHV